MKKINLDDFYYVEWYVTYACNYKCSYCFYGAENLLKRSYMYKTRGPKLVNKGLQRKVYEIARRLGFLKFADSRKNYPVERWKRIFDAMAKRRESLCISFTGGEPLAEEKFIVEMLNYLFTIFKQLVVRIDTNGSIVPKLDGLNSEICITFNVSYHPTQTTRERMLDQLEKLSRKGVVAMVNRVASQVEILDIEKEVNWFKERGYFLNVSPENSSIENYTQAELNILKNLRSPLDIEYPLNKKNIGRPCQYPSFGLILLPTGYAWTTPCSTKSVNLIANPNNIDKLLSDSKIICPAACSCFHQYTWAGPGFDAINFLEAYAARNISWRASRSSKKLV